MSASRFLRSSASCALLVLLVVPACANVDTDLVQLPVVLSMDAKVPPQGEGEEQTFEVRLPVPFEVRPALATETAQLGPLAPYPRTPFLKAEDIVATARFTLTNLDDREHIVELLMDPWNEFVRYEPGYTLDEEDLVPNLSGVDRFIKVPGKSRVVGIVTPDDFLELAKDLGTAQALAKLPPPGADTDDPFAGPVLYNRAFNAQNRSGENDPLLSRFVPKVSAAVIGFDLGLRTRQAANVSIEVTVELVDKKDNVDTGIVIEPGTNQRPQGRPGNVLRPAGAQGR